MHNLTRSAALVAILAASAAAPSTSSAQAVETAAVATAAEMHVAQQIVFLANAYVAGEVSLSGLVGSLGWAMGSAQSGAVAGAGAAGRVMTVEGLAAALESSGGGMLAGRAHGVAQVLLQAAQATVRHEAWQAAATAGFNTKVTIWRMVATPIITAGAFAASGVSILMGVFIPYDDTPVHSPDASYTDPALMEMMPVDTYAVIFPSYDPGVYDVHEYERGTGGSGAPDSGSTGGSGTGSAQASSDSGNGDGDEGLNVRHDSTQQEGGRWTDGVAGCSVDIPGEGWPEPGNDDPHDRDPDLGDGPGDYSDGGCLGCGDTDTDTETEDIYSLVIDFDRFGVPCDGTEQIAPVVVFEMANGATYAAQVYPYGEGVVATPVPSELVDMLDLGGSVHTLEHAMVSAPYSGLWSFPQ